MKKIIYILFVGIFLTACATQRTYQNIPGKLTGIQKNRAINYINVVKAQRIESTQAKYDSLDFSRLAKSAINDKSSTGFKGKMLNLTSYQNVQFNIYKIKNGKISSRAILSETLAPGQQIVRHLLPEDYVCKTYIKGRLYNEREFKVTREMYSIFNEDLHWYIFYE
jgi:hypothetical protein